MDNQGTGIMSNTLGDLLPAIDVSDAFATGDAEHIDAVPLISPCEGWPNCSICGDEGEWEWRE